jgi:hypothetical protein
VTSALGLLDHIQAQLEAIYDLPHPASVSDYLVDRRSLEDAGVKVRASEEVLLLESEAGLDLGLYLAPELFERLRGKDPRQSSGLSLVTEDLSAFAVMAEGVSHVVYLLRCAEQERQVSKLELEAQAEVDKFAISAMHLWGRGLREGAAVLWERLFGTALLRDGLSPEERDRYTTAGNVARDYARRLVAEHVIPGRLDAFLADLRATYRLGGNHKLRAFSVG